MTRITLIAVGKARESYIAAGLAEYAKRLSRYCKFTITEVPDEKAPENASASEKLRIKEKEGKQILAKTGPSAYLIALDTRGKAQTSEDFAAHLGSLATGGKSDIVFAIGGSLGLSDAVRARADESLSFSPMTFPHALFRLMLSEQIYRAYKILAKEPYHK